MTDAATLVPNRVGLPSDANYELKPSGVRSRQYRASILPTNKSTFNPGDLCVMYIPGGRRNTYLDTSQSYLRMTVKNTDATAAANAANQYGNSFWFDNTAGCFINRLDIFHASNLLETIQQYNVLFNYIMDANISSAQKLGLSTMLGTATSIGAASASSQAAVGAAYSTAQDTSRQGAFLRGTEYQAAANTAINQQYTACLPILSGTIGLGSEKYLPLGRMADDLRLEFTFESQNTAVCFTDNAAPTAFTAGAAGAWQIIDIQLELAIIELSDEGEEMVNSMLSPERPIYIHGNSWRHYVSTLNSATQGGVSFLVPARFGSLKTLVLCPRSGASSSAWNQYSLSSRVNPNFSQYWWRIGSNLIPPKYINLENTSNTGGYSEAFAEVQKSWHSLSSPANASCLPASVYNVCDTALSSGVFPISAAGLPTYNAAYGITSSPVSLRQSQVATTSAATVYTPSTTYQNGFVIAQEMESFALRNDVLLSGYNTLSQQVFFEANLNNPVGGTNYTLDFYACYDHILCLENGILSVRF